MHEHSRSMRALLRRLFRAYQDFVSPTRYQVRQFVRSQLRGVRARTCLDLAAGISPYRSDIERATGSEIFISADLYPTDRTTLVCDARRLPFRDGRIDLVCGFDMMTCMPDHAAVLQEARRVLAPEGRLLLTYTFLIAESGVHDFRRWTLRGMEHELRSAGFDVIAHRKRGGFFYSLAMLGAILMNDLVPGTRRSWRAGSSAASFVRMGVASLLMLPFQLFGWIGMHLDRLLPDSPFYFGGMVLARRLDE